MSVKWIVEDVLPSSIMVAVKGTERSEKYVMLGSTSAERTLERAQDTIYEMLEELGRCKSRKCKAADYGRLEEMAYMVGVELHEGEGEEP